MSVIYTFSGNVTKEYQRAFWSKDNPYQHGPKNINQLIYQIGEGISALPTVGLSLLL